MNGVRGPIIDCSEESAGDISVMDYHWIVVHKSIEYSITSTFYVTSLVCSPIVTYVPLLGLHIGHP